jgi:predicted transcriptional regulator
MSCKELVIEVVREMPDDATVDEIVEELALLAAIRDGREDIKAGRFLTHDEIKQQVAAWRGN